MRNYFVSVRRLLVPGIRGNSAFYRIDQGGGTFTPGSQPNSHKTMRVICLSNAVIDHIYTNSQNYVHHLSLPGFSIISDHHRFLCT